MDVILLRKLTPKSVLDFGKYKGVSIQQLIDLKKYNYLRWIYYSCSKITFTDDILKTISIIYREYDNRIEKPGTDLEMHEKITAIMFNKMAHVINPKHAVNRVKKGTKLKYYRLINKENIYFSKTSMQRRNHGK